MGGRGLVGFGGLVGCVAVCGAQPANVKVDAGMDRDLMEISVPGLEKLYAEHRYTVTQVTRWYLDRIAKYDGAYRALLYVDAEGALRRAAEEDASPKSSKHGELWGVPILVKANTSVQGWVTSAGWKEYLIPGKELVAPGDSVA